MIAFFRWGKTTSQSDRIERIKRNKGKRAEKAQQVKCERLLRLTNSAAFNTPDMLLDVAEKLYGQKLYDESQQAADLAILILLRLHYMRAYHKLCTTCSDTEGLIKKLLDGGVITLEQFRHTRELIREATAEGYKKGTRRTLLLLRYLLGILQQTPAYNAPVYRAEIIKNGEVIEKLSRTNDRSIAEGIVAAFNEATPGRNIKARLCTESQSV